MRIARRPNRPRPSTVTSAMTTRVTVPVTGETTKLFFAAGARLSPMSATIAPVTRGGISARSQLAPSTCTTRPMRKSVTPASTTPPRAPPMPWSDFAAAIGAMNAKDDPR